MSGGAWNGICSTHLVSSHTLGTGDVLLFLLLLGAVSSKLNVFFVETVLELDDGSKCKTFHRESGFELRVPLKSFYLARPVGC